MSVSLQDVESALKEALTEAIKQRFCMIASNEIAQGSVEGEKQLRNAMMNLKATYEQAIRIAGEVFS